MAAIADDDGDVHQGRCLEIRTVQASAFKVLIEALKDLLVDTCIEFDATGMKIVAMDNSHIVLVHLKLDAHKFELYHCDGPLCIGVNMLNLHKLIKTINNTDTLTLFMDRTDMNHLCVKIENTVKNSRTVYKLTLLDLDHQGIFVEPTDFAEVVTLPSADFQKICRDMTHLADHMEIKSIRNQLIFTCKGDFCSQETVICDNDGGGSVVTPAAVDGGGSHAADAAGATARMTGLTLSDVPGDGGGAAPQIMQGIFSIKQLVVFTKCTNLCPTMELYLKNDYPLIVKYDVSSLGSIRLALAPQKL